MPQLSRAPLSTLLAVLLLASALTPASAATLTWSIVPSPNPGGASSGNFLFGVSCASANACMAIGENGHTRDDTLAESWDGSKWSVVPSPNPHGTSDDFSGVSCISATSCVAVGANVTGPPLQSSDQTLIESWNGTKWAIVPSPNGLGPRDSLDSVSCVTANACMAVGGAGHGAKTLIESWDGAKWAIVPAPRTGQEAFSSLDGVSCLSPSFCMAVGSRGSAVGQTLAESWNGTKWSVLTSPNVGSADTTNGFLGVSCASPSACTAVGTYQPNTETEDSLIESWNGKAWSIVTSPATVGILYAVSCATRSACIATGGTTHFNAAVESWNGTRWTLAANPVEPDAASELYGVSCAAVTTCAAVGYYFRTGNAGAHTLAESGTAAG